MKTRYFQTAAAALLACIFILATPSRASIPDIALISAEHFGAKRQQLVGYLWGASGMPAYLPGPIESDIADRRYSRMRSLARIDKISIEMDFGLTSTVYLFAPSKPGGQIVIYHQGHAGDFHHGRAIIQRLIESGVTVVAMSMPLLGHNNQPSVTTAAFGRIDLSHHDAMKFLPVTSGSPIRFFVEPVIVVLNYLAATHPSQRVSMIGISGGGWTTTLAAAIDPRIRVSVPVAGTLPVYLRSRSARDWGDYEQTDPGMLSIANYLEMYVLGGAGEGRKQIQILNKFDPCCFAGDAAEGYAPSVRNSIAMLNGGGFELVIDDTHRRHAISRPAMDIILNELTGDPDRP